MSSRIGKDIPSDFTRAFVPADADLGDPGQVEALFGELAKDVPSKPADLERWLLNWSELSAAIQEEEAIRYIRMTCQTDDPEREAAYLHFVEKVDPTIKPLNHQLAKAFLDSPASAELDRDRYFVLVRELRNRVEIYRDENVGLQTDEEKLSQLYQKITGAMTVEHDGEERTLQQMAPYFELPDRSVRKEAWEKVSSRRLEARE